MSELENKINDISNLSFERGRNKQIINLLKFMGSNEVNIDTLLKFVESEGKDIDNNFKLLDENNLLKN